jgi:hypothetical protein
MTKLINVSLSFLLVVFVCLGSSGYAQTSGGAVDAKMAKIIAKVKTLADGNKKVVIETNFGDKWKGRIARYDNRGFTLTDLKTSEEKVFEYTNVRTAKKLGGISTATIITLAAVGTAAAIGLGFLLKRCQNEGGC